MTRRLLSVPRYESTITSTLPHHLHNLTPDTCGIYIKPPESRFVSRKLVSCRCNVTCKTGVVVHLGWRGAEDCYNYATRLCYLCARNWSRS